MYMHIHTVLMCICTYINIQRSAQLRAVWRPWESQYLYTHESYTLKDIGTPADARTHVYIGLRIYLYLCTGWQRCIGCLQLQVSFRKRATEYTVLLQKMIIKDKASYGPLSHCAHVHICLQMYMHL